MVMGPTGRGHPTAELLSKYSNASQPLRAWQKVFCNTARLVVSEQVVSVHELKDPFAQLRLVLPQLRLFAGFEYESSLSIDVV